MSTVTEDENSLVRMGRCLRQFIGAAAHIKGEVEQRVAAGGCLSLDVEGRKRFWSVLRAAELWADGRLEIATLTVEDLRQVAWFGSLFIDPSRQDVSPGVDAQIKERMALALLKSLNELGEDWRAQRPIAE
jgi:hypothetical protein